MIKYILILFLLSSCYHRSSNELEEMSEDVLKAKQGIDIEIKPIPKDPK